MAAPYYLLTFVYTGFIYWLSSQPEPPGPRELFPHFDKVVHIILYALMAGIAAAALRRTPPVARRNLVSVLALIYAAGFGAFDEFHQSFVPLRNFDPLDVVANTTGAVAMLVFLHLWQRWVEQPKPPEAPPQP